MRVLAQYGIYTVYIRNIYGKYTDNNGKYMENIRIITENIWKITQNRHLALFKDFIVFCFKFVN